MRTASPTSRKSTASASSRRVKSEAAALRAPRDGWLCAELPLRAAAGTILPSGCEAAFLIWTALRGWLQTAWDMGFPVQPINQHRMYRLGEGALLADSRRHV